MLTDKEIEENKFRFRVNLTKTHRRGIDKLYNVLEERGFFEKPASNNFHCNYKGGLCEHSLKVFDTFRWMYRGPVKENNLISINSIRIVTLLHDVVKILDKPKNHGLSSVNFLNQHIRLKDFERDMILGHMGFYGCSYNDYFEFEEDYLKHVMIYKNYYEYIKLTNKNPLIKLLHWADDYSSQFLEKIENVEKMD